MLASTALECVLDSFQLPIPSSASNSRPASTHDADHDLNHNIQSMGLILHQDQLAALYASDVHKVSSKLQTGSRDLQSTMAGKTEEVLRVALLTVPLSLAVHFNLACLPLW